MKKLLFPLLILSAFIAPASARVLPEYALLAKPNQYRSYWLTPEYVLNAKQWTSAINSFGIGSGTTNNTIAGSITGAGTYTFNIYNIQ